VGWLIDTNLWIAIERGRLQRADLETITRQDTVFLSPVNVAEIEMGLALVAAAALRQRMIGTQRRMLRKPQLRITRETGVVFGRIAAELRKNGRGADFRVNDLWLAAQAIQRDFHLLTANAKDFRDIPGLQFVVLPIPE
jgi:predicted nucleic acid-binding protein